MQVRRPRASARSAVIAFSDEIDQWLRAAPTSEIVSPPPRENPPVMQAGSQMETLELRERFAKALARNQQVLFQLRGALE